MMIRIKNTSPFFPCESAESVTTEAGKEERKKMEFIWQEWGKYVLDGLPNPSNEKYTHDLTHEFMVEEYMEDVEKFFAPKMEEKER